MDFVTPEAGRTEDTGGYKSWRVTLALMMDGMLNFDDEDNDDDNGFEKLWL